MQHLKRDELGTLVFTLPIPKEKAAELIQHHIAIERAEMELTHARAHVRELELIVAGSNGMIDATAAGFIYGQGGDPRNMDIAFSMNFDQLQCYERKDPDANLPMTNEGPDPLIYHEGKNVTLTPNGPNPLIQDVAFNAGPESVTLTAADSETIKPT